MNNITIWIILGGASVIFGLLDRISLRQLKKKDNIALWFFETWRCSVGYFITGIIGYFLIAIRWPNIAQSGDLSVSDFILCLVFVIGILGWIPYFIKSTNDGIKSIADKLIK